jgi:hypothetical protein
MSMNYFIFYNQFKFSDFKIKKDAKLKATLKKPHVFNLVMSYLDDETIFEVNYGSKFFSKMIKNQIELDYKLLKFQMQRVNHKKVTHN